MNVEGTAVTEKDTEVVGVIGGVQDHLLTVVRDLRDENLR